MTRKRGLFLGVGLAVAVALAMPLAVRAVGQSSHAGHAGHAQSQAQSQGAEHAQHAGHEATHGMPTTHMHEGPHMKLSAPRPKSPEDAKRGKEIVQTLRGVLGKYTDYRAAERDGYRRFGPAIVGREVHFTNWRYGLWASFRFDPERPTSLLYQVTPDGYKLTGAMYTAPRTATEDRLNERVPLSMARWHRHVNLCLPPRGQARPADFQKWLDISTEEQCSQAGGRFTPQLFGWMVHIYPFEQAPDKIWQH